MLATQLFKQILFLAFLTEPIFATISYLAQCKYDADKGFSTTFVVEKSSTDTVNQITALTATNALMTGCTVSQGNTAGQYASTFTANKNGTVFDPSACVFQTKKDSNGNVEEITFKFLIQTNVSEYVFVSDIIIQWKCNTSDHNNVVIENFAVSNFTTNNLGLKSRLEIEVYNSSDYKITSGGQLILGNSYYLKLRHTYANSLKKQVGIYVDKLTFYEGSNSSTTPNVVPIDGGCLKQLPAYGLSQNFLKNESTTPTETNDGVYVIKSGFFQTALWMTTDGIKNNLRLEAVVVQCMYNDQSKCENQQASLCAVGGRKRRDVEDAGLQNLTYVGNRYTISLNGEDTDQNSGKNDAKTTADTCSEMNTTFWLVVLILGILMLLCLIFTVYLFFRLRREKASRKKADETDGIHNPTF